LPEWKPAIGGPKAQKSTVKLVRSGGETPLSAQDRGDSVEKWPKSAREKPISARSGLFPVFEVVFSTAELV
jgi:hypothetical protein